jgi:CheY-like chemotaxis protein
MSLTILLVEDDAGHAKLVERNLKRAGVVNEIVWVPDGQDALDYVRQTGAFLNRPAGGSLLVLLDINMPRVDGIEVLQQLKGSDDTNRIPVIMLSTTDDPREIKRCYELGCSVYVSKPVAYEAFVEAVKRLGLFLTIVQIPQEQLSSLSSGGASDGKRES